MLEFHKKYKQSSFQNKMAGDVRNVNKIEIGFELGVFIASLIIVILHKPVGIFIPWITPLAWVVAILVFILFIIRLFR